MSELMTYKVLTYAFASTTALALPLWLIGRRRAKQMRALILTVVGRGVNELNKRGVPKPRALDRIAPELREAFLRKGGAK